MIKSFKKYERICNTFAYIVPITSDIENFLIYYHFQTFAASLHFNNFFDCYIYILYIYIYIYIHTCIHTIYTSWIKKLETPCPKGLNYELN